MNADGSGETQFTTDTGEAMMPTWSRDGHSIYYVARREGAKSLWKLPLSGGNPIYITGDVNTDALESPDGQRVFFSKSTPGIWEVPANGGEAEIIPELATVLHSRYCFVDAKGIYFLAQTKAPWEIRYFDLATRRISHVIDIPRTPEFFTRSLSVSPAGNWLLYTQVDQSGSEIVMLTDGQVSRGARN
jgi:dipeptidyl aminopeptidase/acylaminoacyl peptidase